MSAYYNELDEYAAQWLRNLISAGHIADGVVDNRSISDVEPYDLRGFTQCHFFAGIGVWSLALRNAGWPDERPVWTGSCPCQPFSDAGRSVGFADERHLWPHWHHLIRERRPETVFGEQVASNDGLAWLDLVQSDMEGEGYAFAANDLCAAGVGAPHIRQRLYFVGYADDTRLEGLGSGHQTAGRQRQGSVRSTAEAGEPVRLADANGNGRDQGRERITAAGRDVFVGDDGLATGQSPTGPTNGHWRDADWLFCRDGKWRPVEPGAFPLAHGATARVGRLRAYGNAIVPQVAQTFIEAFLEVRP